MRKSQKVIVMILNGNKNCYVYILLDYIIIKFLQFYIHISFILYIKTHYKLEIKNNKNENA